MRKKIAEIMGGLAFILMLIGLPVLAGEPTTEWFDKMQFTLMFCTLLFALILLVVARLIAGKEWDNMFKEE
ncbi:hypothetical protein FACS1894132_04680 [Clostridia bacterium]|nr:hypothetical protein FACS1894132_04680 [Clostridia bacterium]